MKEVIDVDLLIFLNVQEEHVVEGGDDRDVLLLVEDSVDWLTVQVVLKHILWLELIRIKVIDHHLP